MKLQAHGTYVSVMGAVQYHVGRVDGGGGGGRDLQGITRVIGLGYYLKSGGHQASSINNSNKKSNPHIFPIISLSSPGLRCPLVDEVSPIE